MSASRRYLSLVALIAAGEAIFILPFGLARVFRPTLLEVFELTNFELGTAFSLYGVVAMACYFPGGPLADRFSARRLMTAALLLTSLGGGLYASIPDIGTVTLLYGFWGLTSILLFWAALIRATREWGGARAQGRAFGLLDGGRGFFAAVLATAGLALFARLLPDDAANATLTEKTAALRVIIWAFTLITAASAGLVWLFVPEPSTDPSIPTRPKVTVKGIVTVAKRRSVWLQALIVICAYVAYKATDDLGLYAKDTLDFDDVESAAVGTIAFWVRPIAGIGAGLLGDRFGQSRMTALSFILLALSAGILGSGVIHVDAAHFFFVTIAALCCAIYGLRGLYFALFEEAEIPIQWTGAAVGIVSALGYTPDIFFGPLMGHLIDSTPGPEGHQHLFAVVSLFALLGLVATAGFTRSLRSRATA